MSEDMTDRNMSPLTQAAYIRSVVKFAAHYRTSPDKLTFKDVRNYQVHLVSRGLMRFLRPSLTWLDGPGRRAAHGLSREAGSSKAALSNEPAMVTTPLAASVSGFSRATPCRDCITQRTEW